MRGAKQKGEGLHQARHLGVFTLKSEGKAFLIGPIDCSLLVTADRKIFLGYPFKKCLAMPYFQHKGNCWPIGQIPHGTRVSQTP